MFNGWYYSLNSAFDSICTASFVAIFKCLYQHFKPVYPLRNQLSAHLSHPKLSEY